MKLFELLRQAGIDPASGSYMRSPFVTVVATPTAEIIRDTRTEDLWHLDMSDDPEESDGMYDAPARSATSQDVEAMHSYRARMGFPSMRDFAEFERKKCDV
ncbi:hypothetical protein [Leisingera caerulea]|uniref:hypothetical protein n=1 Tax=Leisingera caerulea TaxID=506591 RepID=UPI0004847BC5|nr:hypothetical protein [Leisingera caerulea]